MSTYVVVRHKGFLIIASIDRLETFSESSTKPSSKVIWGLGFYQHKNDVKVSLQTRRLNFFFCKYRREQHGANLDNLENLQFKLFATLADCFPYDRRANVKMHVVVLQCTSKQTFGFVFKILFWIAFAVLLFKWNSITPWSLATFQPADALPSSNFFLCFSSDCSLGSLHQTTRCDKIINFGLTSRSCWNVMLLCSPMRCISAGNFELGSR